LVFCLIAVYGVSALSRMDSWKSANSQNQATQYSKLPDWKNCDILTPSLLAEFTFEDMSATFDTAKDTMPHKKKLIHARGTVAPVKFVPTFDAQSKYSGLFRSGGDSCILRISLAHTPYDNQGYAPGIALKCYRDNQPSGNIIAMYSLDGQKEDWDFFKNGHTNIISEPESFALKSVEALTFKRASKCPVWLSLKQFADIDQYGVKSTDGSKHPIQAWFRAADIHFDSGNGVKVENREDFRDSAADIAVGSTVFDVYASDSKGGSNPIKIGSVVTTGQFVSSSWGDNVLFFQHDRGEDDKCK